MPLKLKQPNTQKINYQSADAMHGGSFFYQK